MSGRVTVFDYFTYEELEFKIKSATTLEELKVAMLSLLKELPVEYK